MKKIYFLVIALCFFATTKAQIVTIPNIRFKAKLLAADYNKSIAGNLSGSFFKIDANSDGEIQQSEALTVGSLNVSASGISDLTGIEYFTNLTYLRCEENSLSSLDLSNNKALTTVYCSGNYLSSINLSGLTSLTHLLCGGVGSQLTSLDISSCTALTELYCTGCNLPSLNVSNNMALSILQLSYNQLTSLDVSKNKKLTKLTCNNNKLTSLEVINNTTLTTLICDNNLLTSLDVNSNRELTSFGCAFNQLTSLNVSNNTQLNYISCNNNKLTSLNVSNNSSLTSLECSNNLLTSLFIKNGTNENVYFLNNPNLRYICADESQLTNLELKIYNYGYTATCSLNSYCSFTPGGTFFTIQGNNKLDTNSNGCDVLDIPFPNMKYNITNGSVLGSFISNSSGNYSIPVQAGSHTITPVFENPTYFNVSPSNATVEFPATASPAIKNFCITANAIHPDLEITLLPLWPAVPGFDAIYILVYKNKGNTTQSGSLNLNFNDAVLDLVVAYPVPTTQITNNLSWNFTNLLPFETRQISIVLNVNSPMETPSVVGGSVLPYRAIITSAATDETPLDNTFVFNQTVVNSYDPNDKTCLEGTTISPSLIGQYVHYMIRFENNGTANAQNIVVKDMIDLSKFDITTLVPTNASHSFVSNISAGNKVEFIFENINLPFDDANNDGYIAFKIKTLPTLVVGNTFTNDASIYFDYNFPIVTNKATSTFKTLEVQDFEFSNYFTLYPNPAKEVLNISSNESIEIKSISIYNTLGQLVLVIPNAENVSKIDVSNLITGNYFIKINSDKGTSSAGFIKE
jgi:Leucine-rich repeat (LRR) protein